MPGHSVVESVVDHNSQYPFPAVHTKLAQVSLDVHSSVHSCLASPEVYALPLDSSTSATPRIAVFDVQVMYRCPTSASSSACSPMCREAIYIHVEVGGAGGIQRQQQRNY